MAQQRSQTPTKLILVEGLPGSGKSTTARHIADFLSYHGVDNRLYDEGDHEECVGFFDPATPTYAQDLQHGWQSFVEASLDRSTLAVLAAHYWQNTAFYMYHMGYSSEAIISIIQTLTERIAPLNPMLIYLVHDDVDALIRKSFAMRGEEWSNRIMARDLNLPYHSMRNHTEFRDIIRRLDESQEIASQLFDLFPYRKLKIENPHANWSEAYDEIHTFILP